VGQAAVSDEKLKLLRSSRRVPDWAWPFTRTAILKKIGGMLDARHPGLSDADRSEHLERVGRLLDGARGMDDVSFEMNKEDLAKSLDPQPAEVDTVKPGFRAALFLLLPGMGDVYDHALDQLEKAQRVPAERIDLSDLLGGQVQ
jgi:hypothetical protein